MCCDVLKNKRNNSFKTHVYFAERYTCQFFFPSAGIIQLIGRPDENTVGIVVALSSPCLSMFTNGVYLLKYMVPGLYNKPRTCLCESLKTIHISLSFYLSAEKISKYAPVKPGSIIQSSCALHLKTVQSEYNNYFDVRGIPHVHYYWQIMLLISFSP